MNKDYVKQLEVANEELQRKLEEQGEDLARCERVIRSYSPRLVVFCKDRLESDSNFFRNMISTAHLCIIPTNASDRHAVYTKYQISLDVRLTLFTSVKDRHHRTGSIYDMDMIREYSMGRDVTPYVI